MSRNHLSIKVHKGDREVERRIIIMLTVGCNAHA